MRLLVWISLLSALGAFSTGSQLHRKSVDDAGRSAVSGMWGRDILDNLGTVFSRRNFDRVQLSTALGRVAKYAESSEDAKNYVRAHSSWPKMVARAADSCREPERRGTTTTSQMGGSEIADDLALSNDLLSIAKVHKGGWGRGVSPDIPDAVQNGFAVLSAELTKRLVQSAQRFRVRSGPGILVRALCAHEKLGLGYFAADSGALFGEVTLSWDSMRRKTREL